MDDAADAEEENPEEQVDHEVLADAFLHEHSDGREKNGKDDF